MSHDEGRQIICIACSIFKSELEALRRAGKFNLKTRYLTSMLHMRPGELHQKLETAINQERAKGKEIILLYGDCHPYMLEQSALPGVHHPRKINCPAIVLKPEIYRALRKEGAFFLMPEWTVRWQKVFEDELGLSDKTIAREFMQEAHTKLVYLDTGQMPIPTAHLQAFAAYCGLPWEILPVSPDRLAAIIDNLLQSDED